MAEITLNVYSQIHAEIDGGDKTGIPYTAVILDPLTKSYSSVGKLVSYDLAVHDVIGLLNPEILHNGKNSRFIAGGSGTCQVTLTVTDELGNWDTDTITIELL